jgi:hypothetical protein
VQREALERSLKAHTEVAVRVWPRTKSILIQLSHLTVRVYIRSIWTSACGLDPYHPSVPLSFISDLAILWSVVLMLDFVPI